MIAIKLEHILQINAMVVTKFGGMVMMRDLGRLEAAVATQHQEVFGRELYLTVFEKAAAMLRGIIADHPFVDGNKRTAMLTAMTYLELNGYQFVARIGEIEDFAVRVATDHLEIDDIATWLKCHSQHSKFAKNQKSA